MGGRILKPAALGALLCATGVQAATYQVGPGRPYPNLQAVADRLNPGDVVEVDGNATYPGGVVFERPGTAQQKIVIRGIRIAGRRPADHPGGRVYDERRRAELGRPPRERLEGGVDRIGLDRAGREPESLRPRRAAVDLRPLHHPEVLLPARPLRISSTRPLYHTVWCPRRHPGRPVVPARHSPERKQSDATPPRCHLDLLS